MKSIKKFVVYTVIVCFFCSILGFWYTSIGYFIRDPDSGQLNLFILIGGGLLGPGALGRLLIKFITSDDLIITIISLFSQLIGYLSFAFAMRWIFKKSGLQLLLKNSLRAKKYVKYSLRLIVYTPIIILFVYFYQTQPSVMGKRWVKRSWSLLEKGECEKVFSYLDHTMIRDLENVKNIALGNNHRELSTYNFHLKVISNDLKINMTREQIDNLKPIDIFCWCRKHYDYFFQGNYDISFSSQTKMFYWYDIKRKDKIIGSVVAAHYSDRNWKINWISSECSD